MRALGNYIMRGKPQAIGVVSVMALLSLLLPPLAYIISGVPVALFTLRKGASDGIQVILGAVLATSALSFLVNINITIAPALALGIWAPVWLCAVALRMMESQTILLIAAGGAGLAFVVLMHVFVDDVPGWWQSWFDMWLDKNLNPEMTAQYKELFETAVPLMNAMMAAGLVLSLIVTVLLARWWQSLLFNPGGFRQEFHHLRLPRGFALAMLIGLIFSTIDIGSMQWIFRDTLFILIFMYLFQGLAVVHRTVFVRKLSPGWLIGMYCFLLVMPQMALFIACIGVADSWMQKKLPM